MSDSMRPGIPKSDPSILRLQLVGPMHAVTLGNENVLPAGRKTRGLLAIIAMAGRRPVLRSKLAELLWSRRSEEQARASLRQEIHRLLDALAPVGASVLSVERHAIALRPGLTTVDAERLFNANVNQIISVASARANERIGSMAGGLVAGFHGLPPLDGVLLEELNGTDPALDAWLAAERMRLREHSRALFETALQRQPEPVATIAICRQLLLLDPLHEAAWRGLMRAQILSNERGAALQTAERCVASFSSQAGTPGAETSRLLAELRGDRGPIAADPDMLPTRPALKAEGNPSHGNASDPGATAFGSPPERPGGRSGANSDHALGRESAQPAGASAQDARATREFPAPRGPDSWMLARLAVLPALDLGAAGIEPPSPDTVVPGLTEELIAALVSNPLLSVVGGSTLLQTMAQGRDDGLLRRNFGLDYVLDGTILRGPRRIRIILRLLDLRLQSQVVWARRFDCDPAGAPGSVLERLDDIAAMVGAQLPWEILLIESRRVAARPGPEQTAMQLTLRAFAQMMRSERGASDAAGELLRRAEAQQPDQPLAIYLDALRYFFRATQFWERSEQEAASAYSAIQKAFTAGYVTASTMALAGLIRGRLLDEPATGLALVQTALAQEPHLGIEHAFAAVVLVRIGDLDEAQRRFAEYKRLVPLHPMHHLFDGVAVLIDLLAGRPEQAVARGRTLIELCPLLLFPAVPCLAALGALGLQEEVERLAARIETLAPGLDIEKVLALLRLQRPADRACIADGLRRAGMPERANQDRANQDRANHDPGAKEQSPRTANWPA